MSCCACAKEGNVGAEHVDVEIGHIGPGSEVLPVEENKAAVGNVKVKHVEEKKTTMGPGGVEQVEENSAAVGYVEVEHVEEKKTTTGQGVGGVEHVEENKALVGDTAVENVEEKQTTVGQVETGVDAGQQQMVDDFMQKPEEPIVVAIGCVLACIFTTCACVLVPMTFPIGYVDKPVIESWLYWLVYNPWVLFMYGMATFSRMQRLLFWTNAPHAPADFKLPKPERTPRDWALALGAAAVTAGMFVAVGMLWGPERLIDSYIMLYMAPVSFSLIDQIYWLIVFPKKSKVMVFRSSVLCTVYGVALGAPSFVVLGGIFAGAVASGSWVFLKPMVVLGLVLVRSLVKLFIIRGVGKFARWAGMDTPLTECLGLLQIEATFRMADLILLPNGEPFLVAMGSGFGLLITQVLFYMDLRKNLRRVQQVGEKLPGYVVPKNMSALRANLADTAFEVAFRRHPVYPRLSSVDAHEVRTALLSMLDRHIIMLTMPVVFMCAFKMLTKNGNAKHYFLYECIEDMDHWDIYSAAAAIQFFGLVSIVVDYVLMGKLGLRELMVKLYVIKLRSTILPASWTMAFSGVVFTSCWLIKHDGIKILTVLSPCVDYSMGVY